MKKPSLSSPHKNNLLHTAAIRIERQKCHWIPAWSGKPFWGWIYECPGPFPVLAWADQSWVQPNFRGI